ncbi:MAG: cation-translocating P-type ATPase [Lewinellaceae bacterium]|nr:cation-translocating P-type ATPase [Lewinellaceae bacterium]
MPKDQPLHGLNAAQVAESRRKNGNNSLYIRPKRQFLSLLWDVMKEPMFLLLVLACVLYFAIGDSREAWLMFVSILFVIGIEVIQEYRSEKALKALSDYSQPRVRVIREGESQTIAVEDVVGGDLLAFAEGERIAADGVIQRQNDLAIDEAVLTGESLPAAKNKGDRIFQGTIASSGSGLALVEAVGFKTEFGKLGKSIDAIETEPTPLQRQIDRFVKQMVLAGMLAFLIVLAINYAYSRAFLEALLFSLAFAMALVPEEIPVAFSAFMALGASRMTRQKILVKQPKTVESLGSATVICLDKTGTITENKMKVAELIDFSGQNRVLEYAMWSSEPEPFDAMEKAIHKAYTEAVTTDLRPLHPFIHEYPLGGQPPMMTHVFSTPDKHRIVAAKGAVERILLVCKAPADLEKAVLAKTHELASRGYRVLGVAASDGHEGAFPEHQDDFAWQFEGLLALHDPPKHNIKKVFDSFYQAGIKVKMITGDYPETARNIAETSGLVIEGPVVDGASMLQMSDEELQKIVETSTVFARVFPAAKLRIVEALKANGEVVAMTGDGVNDGPALKSAQIGVAMGHRGTEIAKAAASMVLLDDDLARMITAVAQGRKIYKNLRNAIRYIISIHLPIIMVVVLPLVFGWTYLHILGPVHVIFLELIMDPTCAVAFENEPAEADDMRRPPRNANSALFTNKELLVSLLQGLVISAGVLGVYHYGIYRGAGEEETRALVFTTLVLSNIFLTLINRSFVQPIYRTIFYPNRMLWMILGLAMVILMAILFVPAISQMFKITQPGWQDLALCTSVALLSVVWFELVKIFKREKPV